jgi:soluble lytic murein transglycosylase-like protein
MFKIFFLASCVIASFDSATIVFAQPLASSRSVKLLNFAASPVASAQAVEPPTDALPFDLADKPPDPIAKTESLALMRAFKADILGQLRLDFAAPQIARSRFPLASIGDLASRSGCSQSVYRSAGFLAPRVEARRRLLYPLVAQSVCRHRLPVALLDALIIQESGYDWSARSHVGAYGLAQLMPATARDLGVNRYSIVANLEGGARYLKSQLDRFVSPHLAFAAYNAGPSRVEHRWAVPDIAETRNYVSRITRIWRDLSQHIMPLALNRDDVSVGGTVAERSIAIPRERPHRAVELARFRAAI